MIGDLICDRKDGVKYNAHDFYTDIMGYSDIWPEWADAITQAMDAGTEQDVVTALCNYIKEAGWNGQLCDYISSVKWLEDDPEHSFEVKVTFPKDRLMDEQGRTEKQPFTFSTWVAFCATGRDGDSIQLDNEDGSKDKGLRRRLVNQAWTLASRMGWELWQPIDIEIPMANVTLHQAPKDEQAARELQAMLEKAKANGEHLRQKINVTESIEFHDKAGEA